MAKKIDDFKKERGNLIDFLQSDLQNIKKSKIELKEKGVTDLIKKASDSDIRFKQKLINDLASLDDFDSYDIKKLELIKNEVSK